ncbi:type II toxin-antitoxin system VapC family toxin [Amycolatopsis suaedae]|nr:type II toxin-antitoxin system VapC family toxin [Amycolatopsis suaedae]
MVFADSSALVKLYVPERGHERVGSLAAVVVSELAGVEVPSALWRKHRTGELSAAAARVLVGAFEADLHGTAETEPRFVAVTASPLVLDTAARLTGVHGLRAYDAAQLATAKVVASAEPACRTFATFDKSLADAAAAEGFALLPA